MRINTFLFIGILFLTIGCNDKKPATPPIVSENTKIKESLDQLSPEDRKLAEQQRICPFSQEELGSMGTPIKVMVKDHPVFVCCKNCVEKALKDPDETLRRVEELKSQVGRR